MKKSPSINKQTTLDFIHAAWKYKRLALLSCGIPLAAIILNTAVPLWIGKALGSLVQNSTGDTNTYLLLLIISAVLGVIINRVGFGSFFKLQPKVMADLDGRALQNLLHRSVGFHGDRISGKLVNDTVAYANSFQALGNAFLIDIAPFVISMTLGIVIVFFNSWQLGVLVTLMTASVVGFTIYQTITTTAYREQRHNARRSMIAHMSDAIVNNQAAKTFAGENHELAKHADLSLKLQEYRVRDWSRLASDGSKRIAFLLVFEIAIIVTVIYLVQQDPALLGIGIFTFSYALSLGNRLFDIGATFRTVEDGYLDASDTTMLLHQPLEVQDMPDAKKLHITHGSVSFDNVSFAYDSNTSSTKVFNKLAIDIAAGERVGLVGPSGGGKSTFTKLLLRFDDLSSGKIMIDGQDISNVTQKSLRASISYVPQEPLLFHRTIADNISYGKPKATQEQIQQAAKQAFAHDFIDDLPNSYDTIVGERGVKLSGGQRQRIAIARAILKDAPLLVLDEATAALDSESESYIQSALTELMKNRTVVVIAHRLSTIQKMDRIVVLEDGKIAEQGSHKELLLKNGTYAKLWAHQSGGFIEE